MGERRQREREANPDGNVEEEKEERVKEKKVGGGAGLARELGEEKEEGGRGEAKHELVKVGGESPKRVAQRSLRKKRVLSPLLFELPLRKRCREKTGELERRVHTSHETNEKIFSEKTRSENLKRRARRVDLVAQSRLWT